MRLVTERWKAGASIRELRIQLLRLMAMLEGNGP
jgi:hypothetical protein